ncbi:MAG: DnaA regulatory inactivator Hda [Spiribacter sp.]|nr:DnaA regulatory inactivator Hda [Spiribacter sp.]MDR9454275.1 DnaA regulatory inactivator Hda [Spiribacter sp.]
MTGSASTSPQLALDFRWDTRADFASFIADGNTEAVSALRTAGAPASPWMYVWGQPGTGKSHLMQAACGEAGRTGATAVYVPLADYPRATPDLLEGLERVTLVVLDDLHCIAGKAAWEEAVFHLHNRLRDAGGQLIVAAAVGPDSLGLGLADLVSRLQALLQFRLSPPDDARRRQILSRAAGQRGLALPQASADYLLRHEARDLRHLLACLERLDAASLQSGRRLTVPFIKTILGAPPPA